MEEEALLYLVAFRYLGLQGCQDFIIGRELTVVLNTVENVFVEGGQLVDEWFRMLSFPPPPLQTLAVGCVWFLRRCVGMLVKWSPGGQFRGKVLYVQ